MNSKLVSKPKPRKRNAPVTKLFVLDTNVLLHDPTSVYRFEEHDVFLPMNTLEELDNNKKGLSDVARNARQVTRMLDVRPHLRVTMCFPSESRILAALSLLPSANMSGRKGGGSAVPAGCGVTLQPPSVPTPRPPRSHHGPPYASRED